MRTLYPAIEVYAYKRTEAVRRINGSAYRLLGYLGACGKPNALTILGLAQVYFGLQACIGLAQVYFGLQACVPFG